MLAEGPELPYDLTGSGKITERRTRHRANKRGNRCFYFRSALRVIAALANEAAFALAEGVASAEDIDRAMQLGATYPEGPLAWADELRLDRVVRVLAALREAHGDAYVCAPLLRQRHVSNRPVS